MKTKFVKPFLIAFGLLVLAASSCKKADVAAANLMTDEEAAEAISLSVSASTNGLSTQTEEIAMRANAYSNICSYSKDSTITKVNTAGAYTWNYVFKWQWSVVCTNGIPNTMNANYSMKGSYDAPRMSSNDSAIANLAITNLLTGSQYTYNGTYTRDGSQVSKIRNNNRFNSKVVLGLTNLKVNKLTGQIDAGSATVTISGTTNVGNSFNYGGSITFNGSRTATITLSNGGVYNITW